MDRATSTKTSKKKSRNINRLGFLDLKKVSIEVGENMQNINLDGMQISNKLLVNLSTRVPEEVQVLVDDVAKSNGLDRAKWMREAIRLKLEVDLNQSSISETKYSTNTTNSNEYINFFKSIFSFFQTNKKPDVRDRALSVH